VRDDMSYNWTKECIISGYKDVFPKETDEMKWVRAKVKAVFLADLYGHKSVANKIDKMSIVQFKKTLWRAMKNV
jgi:hypothetical protein